MKTEEEKISEYFSKLGKKSWEKRKEKLLKKSKSNLVKKENV